MKKVDIATFAKDLENRMKDRLNQLHQNEMDPTVRYSRMLLTIGEVIHELREFVVKNDFAGPEEEIQFFKEIKPLFLSQHHYYRRLLELKTDEPAFQSQKVTYYLQALERIQADAKNNTTFFHYCLTGASNFDEKYFVRGNIPLSEISFDRGFSTGYDEQLSQLLTARLLKDHIMGVIHQLAPGEEVRQSPLTWTGSKADLIELIYGLETIGALNKGKADIKEIASLFENAFNISLGNYYRQFLDIRLRKKGKTIFLDEMKEKLEVRINDFS